MSALDYIREYEARRHPVLMAHPRRHINPLVRALWWKRKGKALKVIVDGCAKPSAEYDEAYDAMCQADENHEAIILSAWENRCMSRGYVPTDPTTPTAVGERYSTTGEAA